MATTMNRGLVDRMKGAAMLNTATYEEVEADSSATSQAATVVVIVAIAQAIGAIGSGSLQGIILAPIGAIVGWLVWAGITYLVGDKLLGGTATWGELLRTIGFAQSPGVLSALAFIPVLGWLVRFVVGIWILIAGIIAIRQALDFGTGKAVLTAILGWLAIAIPMALLGAMLS